jgi:hypothetical protein
MSYSKFEKKLGVSSLSVKFSDKEERAVLSEQKRIVKQLKGLSDSKMKAKVGAIVNKEYSYMQKAAGNVRAAIERKISKLDNSKIRKLSDKQIEEIAYDLPITTGIPTKVYPINGNTSISFSGDSLILSSMGVLSDGFKDSFSATQNKSIAEFTQSSLAQKPLLMSSKKSKTKSKTEYAYVTSNFYNGLGMLWRDIYVEGKFTFNKKKVTAAYATGWDHVHDLNNIMTEISASSHVVRGSGSSASSVTFYATCRAFVPYLNITIDNQYDWAEVDCSKTGVLQGYTCFDSAS